jgi:hypothetical protein
MSKKNKLQILSVRVEHKLDEDPDTSYLGKFTDDAMENAIVRVGDNRGKFVREIGDGELPTKGREFRFFLPAMTGEETGSPESPQQDWQRMEALNDGHWHFIGIIAKAEIRNPQTSCVQTIHSGGVWGIESDSSPEYFVEAESDQLAQLKAELLALSNGVGERAIAYAIKHAIRPN